MPNVKNDQLYTYQDYLTWDDEERWEIIEGYPYNMTPAPNKKHQQVLRKLIRKIDSLFDNHPCELIISPFDVVLSEHNVVQPDLVIVCNQSKFKDQNVDGAPDVMIEIISPSSGKKDRNIKRKLYEKFGSKEYVLIDSESCLIECYRVKEIFEIE